MSNEVLPIVPEYLMELLQEASAECIADVLRPWNCYAQEWADDYMRLFRFENDDVLIWFKDGSFQGNKGAVDTSSFNLPHLIDTEKNPAEEMCLCWISDRSYSQFVGEQVPALELLDDFF